MERANWTVLNVLATIVKEHYDWESYLRATCMAYNTSIQSTIGFSPFFLMFGRRARIPVDVLHGTNLSEIQSVDNYVVQQNKFWMMLISGCVCNGS